MSANNIRYPIAAGSFYDSDPSKLKKQIRNFLDNAQDLKLDKITTLIVPHAGYIYSGQVAAHAYRQIEGKDYDCILVIAPSHSELFDFVSIYPGGYQTPLGIAGIDEKNSQMLEKGHDLIKFSAQGHKEEHSLEVQIPFLQEVLGDIEIIPMAIGNQSPDLIKELGNTVGKAFSQMETLIIASSDLSHYHPYKTALSLDQKVEKLVADFDIQGLADSFFGDRVEMCGGGPVLAAMTAARILGSKNSKVISYRNSGDIIGDRSAVVGYLSAVFY